MSLALIDPAVAVQAALIILGGAFAAGALINAFAARLGELRADHAALSCMCASMAAFTVTLSWSFASSDSATHATLARIQQLALLPFWVAYATHLARAAALPRARVALVATAAAVITCAATLASGAGLWYARIESVDALATPWGEEVMIGRGPPSAWLPWILGCWMALSGFGVWSALRHARQRAAIGAWPLLVANGALLAAPACAMLTSLGTVGCLELPELLAPILALAVWWRLRATHERRASAWRRLFARAGEAMFVHEAESGDCIAVNDEACRLFGAQERDLLPRGLGSALGDDEFWRLLASATGPGTAVREIDCRRRDGSAFPAEVALRSSAIGERAVVVASVRDVSMRRLAESVLVKNERHLRLVLERCPFPVADEDIASGHISVNPSFIERFGTEADARAVLAPWSRRGASGYVGPEGAPREGAMAGVAALHRGGISDRLGRDRQVDISSVEVGGRRVTFINDLTDILSARDALADQEALHRAIIEGSTDGVAVQVERPGDAGPAIQLWNPRMAAIIGLDAAAARRRGWADILPPHHRRLLGHESRDVEVTLNRADGLSRVCLWSGSELPATAEGRRQLILVRDIDDQRRVERERRDLEAQAQHARRFDSLGVLAGGIAHDFNNLLMTILGRVGLVRATLAADDAATAHDLAVMESAATRAAGLCQQLLAYAGKGGVMVGALDLQAELRAMQDMLTIMLPKRIVFEQRLSGGSTTLTGDGGQLRQVVMNLVSNAAEALGEREGRIVLSVARVSHDEPHATSGGALLPAGPYIRLEVADSGCGMDEEIKSRMFEPFFSTKFTGRGLGLAVVSGIVRGHRGGIDVESAPGDGTRMVVLLPALEERRPAPPAPRAEQPAGRATVLVVDDEHSMRVIASDMVAHLGYAVREAASGGDAVDAFAGAGPHPGIVILDLTLPDIDGVQVLTRIRELDRSARVIIASGYSRDDISRFISGPAPDGILSKPYTIADLEATLRACAAEGA